MKSKHTTWNLLVALAVLAAACGTTTKTGGSEAGDDATATDDASSDDATGDSAMGGDGLANDTIGGTGQLDGVWKLVSCTCDGANKDVGNGVTYGFTGSSGVITSPIDGTCTMLLPTTVSYPSNGAVEWTVLTANCQPTACYSACGQTFNMKHTATYSVSGKSLTLTEAKTPLGEYACPEKLQVCQLTRM